MKKLPKSLKRYKDSEFSIQQSVRFFNILLFCISILMLLLLIYTAYLQINDPIYGKLYFPVLLPELSGLLIVSLCYVLLIKGYFLLSSHVFLTSTFIIIWIGLWLDRGNLVQRFDTVSFVMAVLTMIPIFFNKNARSIFVYSGANILILFGILISLKKSMNIPDTTIIDIQADYSVSLIFISIVGYTLSRINKQNYDKAVDDFKEKLTIKKALSESETKYKNLTDLLPQVVWEIDLNGKFTYTNRMGLDLYGYTETEFTDGIFISDIIISEQSEKMYSNIKKQISGTGPIGEEYISIKKNGLKFPVQIFSNVILKEGKPIGLRGITMDISERKKTEKDLIESEGRYKALMESMNEIIIVADNDHKVEYVNNQFTQKLGYTKEEIIGQIGYKILHDPEDLNVVEEANSLRMADKNNAYELKFKAKNGTKYDFLVSGAPYKNAEGDTIGSIGALMDITERKKTEQKLIESEANYRTLFENAQIGIYQTTPDGKILNGNPAIFQMVGFNSINELENKSLESGELMNVIARDKFKELIEKDGFVKNFETEWKNKNGETIYVIENSRAVKDPDGKTLYYDGFVENITERKKADRELKESEQRYRSIIEAFPDILMISDLKGNIVFLNEVGQKTTGITPDAFNEPTKIANVHTEDLPSVINATKELLLGKKEHSNIIENKFIDAWGKIHWFSGIISKITMNGQIMLQTISRDITEKKANELELEKYRNHLETLVKDRTEELSAINEELTMSNEELTTQREILEDTLQNLKDTQNQLIQSEKMASLGIMAAGVAHEINNPLNFINGGIIGIEKWIKINHPEQIIELEPLLNGINEGIRRATNIVTSLNKYTRNDETTFRECDIPSIIESCLLMLSYQIKDTIHVKKEYQVNNFIIFGNEGRLHQAFLNVLSNSVQAIQDTGNIKITINLKDFDLEIVIEDNGQGISKENMSKIMDPFFTTKEPGKGTGLGLTITYAIIKEHNGIIECVSEPGKGTKTIIKLPGKN